jgi:hypothetical protein
VEDEDLEDRFVITGPLWVAVHHLALEIDPATGKPVIADAAGIQSFGTRGHLVAVFFTDQDLAERFVEATDKLNLVPIRLDSPHTFVRILEDLQAQGYESAAFDVPPGGGRSQGNPIAQLLTILREKLGPRHDSHEQQ